jgi:GrpB-like predicted nucleotidyltransferase (UPF0157 family)
VTLGAHKDVVLLVPHHPEWTQRFREERERLARALDATGCEIEHIGSTAVPGMLAKPILDIAVGHPHGADPFPLIRAIEDLGYAYRGDAGDDGGHVLVLESEPLVRVHHLHLVEHGARQWRAYLDLRDLLRRNPDARAAYAERKRILREAHPRDRVRYTDGKDGIVRELLRRARRERTGRARTG